MTQKLKRRLAAIVSADIAGYSALMAQDEVATLSDLREFRQEVFEPSVKAHSGHIIKSMGDGWLLEFDSIVDAVNSAVEIQKNLQDHKTIRIRIGVHVGDIVRDKEDIFGDGVNVAARLQECAEPGTINLSEDGWKFLKGKSELSFISLGEHSLKNIADNIQIYGWSPDGKNLRQDVELAGVGQKSGRVPTIKIDPFKSSGDTEVAQDLCEDLQDTLVISLSRRSGIKVISENNGHSASTYVIAGRVRVSQMAIKLNLLLQSGDDGRNIWAERFKGDVEKVDEFIDLVSKRADSAIRTQINAFHGSMLAEQPDTNLSVEDLLAKAAYLFYSRGIRNSTKLARQSLEVAVKLAPQNPMALAMLAHSYVNLVPYSLHKVNNSDAERALTMANRAVELGPRMDFAFRTRAAIKLWFQSDHVGAQADARRALEINPNYHMAMETLAASNIFAGQPEEGIKVLKEVISLAPYEPQIPYYYSLLALANLYLGEDEVAKEYASEAYERRPGIIWFGLVQAAVFGDTKSETDLEGIESGSSKFSFSRSCLSTLPFRRDGDVEVLESRLIQAGVPA